MPHRLVMSNGLWLEATDGEHPLWKTRRISWNGMMNLRVDGGLALGEAYDPATDECTSLYVDLENGEVPGGSYHAELLKLATVEPVRQRSTMLDSGELTRVFKRG